MTGVLFNCNNGTWDSIVAVDPSFSEEFLIGGPMGFSCDLTTYNDEYNKRWSDVIAQYKKDREFYQRASARILVDTDPISVIEYADEEWEQCVIQIFTKTVYANDLIVYPTVKAEAKYSYGDTEIDGADLLENGLRIKDLKPNFCRTVKLMKKSDK